MAEWFQRRKVANDFWSKSDYSFVQNPVTYVIHLIKIKLLFKFQLILQENSDLLAFLYLQYSIYSNICQNQHAN